MQMLVWMLLYSNTCFFVGYKGGKIYWLATHSNQAHVLQHTSN
jgi:hypothetical protein